jgi:hypothetical protein
MFVFTIKASAFKEELNPVSQETVKFNTYFFKSNIHISKDSTGTMKSFEKTFECP